MWMRGEESADDGCVWPGAAAFITSLSRSLPERVGCEGLCWLAWWRRAPHPLAVACIPLTHTTPERSTYTYTYHLLPGTSNETKHKKNKHHHHHQRTNVLSRSLSIQDQRGKKKKKLRGAAIGCDSAMRGLPSALWWLCGGKEGKMGRTRPIKKKKIGRGEESVCENILHGVGAGAGGYWLRFRRCF